MSKKIFLRNFINVYQKNAKLKIQYVRESPSVYLFKRSKRIDGDASCSSVAEEYEIYSKTALKRGSCTIHLNCPY